MSVMELERELDKLEKDPANPALIFSVGKSLYQLKDFESALAYFSRAHELEWENAELIERMGDCCFLLGDYKQALTMYDLLYRQETEVDRARSEPWTWERLLREQMIEQMIWQFFRNYRINTVGSLRILVLSTANDKWTRKLLNWGASLDLLEEADSIKGQLPFDHQTFDLIVWETNSEKFDEKEMEGILMELNRLVKQSGLILRLHQGDPAFSHSQTKNFSGTMAEMKNWWRKLLVDLEKETRVDVLPFSIGCF